jgi:hypothetical protein
LINCEERNAEKKNRTENNILEYKETSTMGSKSEGVSLKEYYAMGNS